MMTVEFLQNFGSTFPSSRLILYTSDMDMRDYFINVASILFNITIIYKNRDQFLSVVSVNEGDVSLIINFEEDLSKMEMLTQNVYKVEKGEIIHIRGLGETVSEREEEKEKMGEKFLEPIMLYKLLTI
jgi:hypothetical protein